MASAPAKESPSAASGKRASRSPRVSSVSQVIAHQARASKKTPRQSQPRPAKSRKPRLTNTVGSGASKARLAEEGRAQPGPGPAEPGPDKRGQQRGPSFPARHGQRQAEQEGKDRQPPVALVMKREETPVDLGREQQEVFGPVAPDIRHQSAWISLAIRSLIAASGRGPAAASMFSRT